MSRYDLPATLQTLLKNPLHVDIFYFCLLVTYIHQLGPAVKLCDFTIKIAHIDIILWYNWYTINK